MTRSIRFAAAGLALATLLLIATDLRAQEEEDSGNAVQSGTSTLDDAATTGEGIAGSAATGEATTDEGVTDETATDETAIDMPATTESMIGAGMTGGYCPPGCLVGPTTGGPGMTMSHGMTMDHGMMGGGTMPMLSGLMFESPIHQGALPGMSPGLMAQGTMPSMAVLTMVPTMAPQRERLLTVDDVRPVLEHHIAMMGLPNLGLGTVEEQDDDTIVAEIVLQDGTLVQRLAIDRQRGTLEALP